MRSSRMLATTRTVRPRKLAPAASTTLMPAMTTVRTASTLAHKPQQATTRAEANRCARAMCWYAVLFASVSGVALVPLCFATRLLFWRVSGRMYTGPQATASDEARENRPARDPRQLRGDREQSGSRRARAEERPRRSACSAGTRPTCYEGGEASSDCHVEEWSRRERPIAGSVLIFIFEPICCVWFDKDGRAEDCFVGG